MPPMGLAGLSTGFADSKPWLRGRAESTIFTFGLASAFVMRIFSIFGTAHFTLIKQLPFHSPSHRSEFKASAAKAVKNLMYCSSLTTLKPGQITPFSAGWAHELQNDSPRTRFARTASRMQQMSGLLCNRSDRRFC